MNSYLRHCIRIEVAGSIRRLKPEISDIEIVCIPKAGLDLFGNPSGRCGEFERIVDSWGFSKGDARHGKFIQRILPNTGGFKVDIFIANTDFWGWQLALRTGSSEFNINVLLAGLKATNHKSEDGIIYYCGDGKLKLTPVKEEADLFKLIGLAEVPPHLRNA